MVWSLLGLSLFGCSGIAPYTPPNQRENGLKSGLFSGSSGGFVVYQSGDRAGNKEKKPPVDAKSVPVVGDKD